MKSEDIRKLSPEEYDSLRSNYYGVADHIYQLCETLKELGFKKEYKQIKKMTEVLDQTDLGKVL